MTAISTVPMALRYCSRSGVFGQRAEFSRIDIIGVQNLAGLKISGGDLSRASGAALLLAIGSLRQANRKCQGSMQSRSSILRACENLKAISAVLTALHSCSRSGVFGNRAELLSVDIVGVQKSGAPEIFWRRSQPRLWRGVIARDREPSASEQKKIQGSM